MRRFWIVLMVFVIGFAGRASPLFAADKKPDKAPHHILAIDTGKLVVRHLDSAALKKYSNDPAFDYTHEQDLPQQSWWDRFWSWFWAQIAKLFSKVPGGGNAVPVIKYLLMGMLAFAVIYLLLRLLKIDLLRLFRKHKNNDAIPYAEFAENIHEINFDESINKALADKNYRLAVRLLYLRSLKQLNDAGLIHWRMEKTNLTYLNEIENPDYKQLFGALTIRFEYVWYGDFQINSDAYQRIDTMFREFNSRLS
jgi:hypothetical protein